MNGRDRTALYHARHGCSVRIVQTRRLTWRLAVDQTNWTLGVERQNPITDDMHRHAPDPGILITSGAAVDGRQGKKTTNLIGVI